MTYINTVSFCVRVSGEIGDPAGAPPSSVGTTGVPPDSGCGQDGVRYLSVMWCKASKKKHKRWEGDAVLITRGRTATLKDMEGKDIGKGERALMQLLMLTTHTRLKTFIYIVMSCQVRIVSIWWHYLM